MEVRKYPSVLLKKQTDEAVHVQVCFRGKADHNHYCVKLRIPKDLLKDMTGEHTADKDPQVEG